MHFTIVFGAESRLLIFSTNIREPSTKIPHSTPDSQNLLKLKQMLGIFEREKLEKRDAGDEKKSAPARGRPNRDLQLFRLNTILLLH